MHGKNCLVLLVVGCWFLGSGRMIVAEDTRHPEPNAAQTGGSYRVQIPKAASPFPEPLPAGQTEPGFKIRGIKGWCWTPEQYLEEIPILAKYKMNFLMNCYLSMFSSLPQEPWLNEWWKPLPEEKKAKYAKVIRACKENGINFCFLVHPQLASPRPLKPTSMEDIDQYYQHYAWAQSEGVQWFSISLDDVNWGSQGPATGGSDHAKLVNTIFSRLRVKDPQAQMIFCPVPYWGDGTPPDHRAYLEALGKELHSDVYVSWTGDAVVTLRITREAAESYKGIVKHRMFICDNYFVNDGHPTLHLGAVSGRDADLGEVIDGYISNSMFTQHEINRIPMATCADYAYNPKEYDPTRSIGQAIFQQADTDAQRNVLKDLVETYPGLVSLDGGNTATNPVRENFKRLISLQGDNSRAKDYLRHMEDLAADLDREFPNRYSATKKTVVADILWMKDEMTKK